MTFTVRKLDRKKPSARVWAGRIAAVLTISQPLVHFYGRWKEKRVQKKRVTALKRIFTILVAVLFALFLFAAVAKALMSVRSIGMTDIFRVAGSALEKDEHGFTNFLLLGQGHSEHDGKNLTDTIMVASIDPENTGASVLLSLPRDLYLLKTERIGKGKLNTMFRDVRSHFIFQKGMEEKEAVQQTLHELKYELGRSLGLDIHYTVKVDFIAFEKAVDLLGGIDIEVPYTIEDNDYPDENFGYEPFVIQKGMQHLDGATALKYARSRSTTSDFSRSARQQQILKAMAHKAKEEGVIDGAAITSFMKIMSENIATTMSLREMIGAADLAQKLDKDKVVTMQLSDRNALYDSFIEPGGFLYTPPRNLFEGASVLLPVSIPEFPVTWKQPQALATLLFKNRDVYLRNPSIAILNAGAPPGSARKLSTELTRYGFSVALIENAETDKLESSMIIAPPEPDDLVEFFSTLFSVQAKPAPADLPSTQKKRVTMILGRDYKYTPLQNLVGNLSPPSDDS